MLSSSIEKILKTSSTVTEADLTSTTAQTVLTNTSNSSTVEEIRAPRLIFLNEMYIESDYNYCLKNHLGAIQEGSIPFYGKISDPNCLLDKIKFIISPLEIIEEHSDFETDTSWGGRCRHSWEKTFLLGPGDYELDIIFTLQDGSETDPMEFRFTVIPNLEARIIDTGPITIYNNSLSEIDVEIDVLGTFYSSYQDLCKNPDSEPKCPYYTAGTEFLEPSWGWCIVQAGWLLFVDMNSNGIYEQQVDLKLTTFKHISPFLEQTIPFNFTYFMDDFNMINWISSHADQGPFDLVLQLQNGWFFKDGVEETVILEDRISFKYKDVTERDVEIVSVVAPSSTYTHSSIPLEITIRNNDLDAYTEPLRLEIGVSEDTIINDDNDIFLSPTIEALDEEDLIIAPIPPGEQVVLNNFNLKPYGWPKNSAFRELLDVSQHVYFFATLSDIISGYTKGRDYPFDSKYVFQDMNSENNWCIAQASTTVLPSIDLQPLPVTIAEDQPTQFIFNSDERQKLNLSPLALFNHGMGIACERAFGGEPALVGIPLYDCRYCYYDIRFEIYASTDLNMDVENDYLVNYTTYFLKEILEGSSSELLEESSSTYYKLAHSKLTEPGSYYLYLKIYDMDSITFGDYNFENNGVWIGDPTPILFTFE